MSYKKSKGQWPNMKLYEDLKKFVDSLDKTHHDHDFQFAIIEYGDKHLGVTRCVDCDLILGAVPIPYEQYTIIKTTLDVFQKFEKEQKRKGLNKGKPSPENLLRKIVEEWLTTWGKTEKAT